MSIKYTDDEVSELLDFALRYFQPSVVEKLMEKLREKYVIVYCRITHMYTTF